MVRWCADALLIGVAYAVAGRIGQFFAAPPIYATAVWPASGIALAGVLLLGYRVWPGLFLGAMVVNSWSGLLDAGGPTDVLWTLLLSVGISIGVTLQTIVGAWLIRRFVGFPNALNRDRDILMFLGLGGPLACTIGASIGVASLLAAGSYHLPQAALNWWTWWVGDVIGVIIFVPITLILFAHPRPAWRARRITVAVPLCVTLAAVTAACALSHVSQRQQNRLRFERRASYMFNNVKEFVSGSLDLVHSMQGFYAGSVDVTRDEFEVFHRHRIARHKAVQALEWIPHVPRDLRKHHETLAREEGFSQFQFTERATNKTLVRAADRPEYYPVYYVVPYRKNEVAVGFDLGSNELRRRALFEARDTGQQVATAPITLVQEQSRQLGFLVLAPIYVNNAKRETIEDRRDNLRGFVSGVFRIGDIIEATLPAISSAGLELKVVDSKTGTDGQEIYTTGHDRAPSKANESALSEEIRWTATLPVAGRLWIFEFVPNQKFFSGEAESDTWLVLAGGLLFTSLLSVFLMIQSGKATLVEELVVERTDELTSANRELEFEIAERKRYEEALSRAHEDLERRIEERTADLKESEARYQDLYDHAPDMFASVDVATQRLIECNQTLLTATGFDKHDLIGKQVFDLYHEDSLETAHDYFQTFLATGSVKDVELNIRRKNGELLAVSLNVSSVRDERGQLMYSRAVLRDIREKKVAEAKIKRHEEELAHVARLNTMGEMAAGLAHEINQPLAAIAAYADGIAIRIKNRTINDAQLSTIVGHIASDAHRAGEVIRRLRQFVRNRESDRAPVEINSLVLDVSQFVAPDATQRQIRVQLDLADDLPPAMSDGIEFQQVLLNLVRNGFDAMADTPEDERMLTIRTMQVDKTIKISVEDQGHGLPGITNEQVFEAFFTSKEEGLGMGLAISRSIIESHGGRIWATPLGTGAVFHFTLPIATGVDTGHDQ